VERPSEQVAPARQGHLPDDAADATLLAAVNPRAEGEVLSVGTGSEIFINELVAADKPSEVRCKCCAET